MLTGTRLELRGANFGAVDASLSVVVGQTACGAMTWSSGVCDARFDARFLLRLLALLVQKYKC
jgi:hypothetical protein